MVNKSKMLKRKHNQKKGTTTNAKKKSVPTLQGNIKESQRCKNMSRGIAGGSPSRKSALERRAALPRALRLESQKKRKSET